MAIVAGRVVRTMAAAAGVFVVAVGVTRAQAPGQAQRQEHGSGLHFTEPSPRMVTAQSRVLAITGVTVVDVLDGHVVPNRTVIVTGDTIGSITANGVAPRGAKIVDGQNGFLIPGLWDMHAHTEGAGESSLRLHVANGVTSIRDMGSDLDLILRLRAATASGRLLGPRIVAAGPILDDAPGDWPFRMRVKTAADGRAAVRLLKRRGVDLIKVHNNTPRDAFFAIADEARRQNLPLAGHVPLTVTPEEAINAGLTSIEHLSEGRLWASCSGGQEYRPEPCRPLIEMLARRHIWQTPTLVGAELVTIGTAASSVPAEQVAYASRHLREMWAANQREIPHNPAVTRIFEARARSSAAMTADMANAGVPLLAGCDAVIAGFCLHDELAAMVRSGMSPLAALQTATINPARYFGRDKTLGSIAPGKAADLVLLEGNPLAGIENVRRIRAVVVAGRFLDRRELDQILAQVKAAANQ